MAYRISCCPPRLPDAGFRPPHPKGLPKFAARCACLQFLHGGEADNTFHDHCLRSLLPSHPLNLISGLPDCLHRLSPHLWSFRLFPRSLPGPSCLSFRDVRTPKRLIEPASCIARHAPWLFQRSRSDFPRAVSFFGESRTRRSSSPRRPSLL